MIGAFWNIRSLNKTGKLECLRDFINTHKLDFIGIQETKKKESFRHSFFTALGVPFVWNFLPACGTAGGILVGFRDSKFNILRWDIKQFCISAYIQNTCDNFSWRLVTVYGSAYKEGKQEFIDELHEVMNDWDGPTLIGGDFNLVRHISEKNNGNINFHWSYSFNDWINRWGLIEFKNPSRTYTWTNNQEQPIMAVLDRILASTNFEAHYPMANVKSTLRLGSDHIPLIINLGEAQEIKPHLFRFEKWWLEQKNLADIVRDSWNDHCPLSNPLDIW